MEILYYVKMISIFISIYLCGTLSSSIRFVHYYIVTSVFKCRVTFCVDVMFIFCILKQKLSFLLVSQIIF